MTERMTTQDIVRRVFGEADFEKFYGKIYGALQTKKYRMMRKDNTLFLYNILEKGAAHVSIISADSGKQAFTGFLECLETLKKSKFKKVYVELPNIALSQVIKAHDYKVHELDNNKYMVEL